MQIGFIGLGIMGRSMARNLMRAGHSLQVYSRTYARCADIIAEGAFWRDCPAEAAAGVDAVVTMVGYPADVEDVYFGEPGILSAAAPGTLLIDMTTSAPELARRIHAAAARRGLRALDAPVSGGDIGARNATLAIMVGGAAEDFAAAQPVLTAMGKTIVHLGPAGSGQHCKLANQIVIAGTMLGVAEGLRYAERAGLDPATVLSVIGGGAAASAALANLGPKMLAGDFAPGFLVEHFVKDMDLALAECAELGQALPGLELVRALYGRLAEDGCGREGTQALAKAYRGR